MATGGRRRVLVLNHFALPRSAPGGTRHVELFGRLEGWDATVVASNKDLQRQHRVASEGILVTVAVPRYTGNGLGRILNWAAYSAGALARGLLTRRPAVVYGSSPHLGAALAGLLVARLRRARFVIEIRDLWPQILVEAGTLRESSPVFRVLKALERRLYRSADAIVVLAEGSAGPITADGGRPDRIVFIPNGAQPEDFDVTDDRSDLRAALGFEGFVVVYAGAHGPANGLGFVLDAAEELRDVLPHVHFVLVGDGIEKARLISDAARRGLVNLTFLDPIPKTEIPRLLAAADAGLHCLADVELFRSAVSPNKLYDYMAAALPALTNTPGAVADMVRDAGAGVAVQPDRIADAVRAVCNLTPAERAAMGRAGRAFVDRYRSRTAMAERLEALLNDVAARRPLRR